MNRGKYRILTKRHLAALAVLVFLLAALILAAAVLAPYAYANAAAEAGRRLPICCTDRADRVVSLTFDFAAAQDGGDGSETEEILAVLARYHAAASFFVTGEWAQRHPETVKALHGAGHEVMNLTDTYPHLPGLPRDEIIHEIQACSDKIQALTGVRPALFRAPYGEYDDALLQTADMLGTPCVQWDVDFPGGEDLSAGEAARRTAAQVSSGSIVRFRSGAGNIPQALEEVLRPLQADGYAFLPVSAMVYTENYALNREGRQISLGG